MPTIRSEYGFDQFTTLLQKFAYEVAMDAVTDLRHDHVRIDIGGHRFQYVDTGKYMLRFSPSRISFMKQDKTDHWSFEIEEKLYMTSNHRTKISFIVAVESVYDEKTQRYIEHDRREKEKAREKEIREFIEKMMTQNSMKPMPRFSLKTGPA
ncbi:MAG: hypothetical protein ABSB28_05440 [Candidatus Bathyarchaeia archaeon]